MTLDELANFLYRRIISKKPLEFTQQRKKRYDILNFWVSGLILARKLVKVHDYYHTLGALIKEQKTESPQNYIFISNHYGSSYDIFLMARIVPRRLYYLASHVLYSKEGIDQLVDYWLHRRTSAKKAEFWKRSVWDRISAPVSHFVTRNIRYFSIPVVADYDWLGTRNSHYKQINAGAIEAAAEGYANSYNLVIFPGTQRHIPSKYSSHFPQISKGKGNMLTEFKKGFARIAVCANEKYGKDAKIIPLAIVGARGAFYKPGTINVMVGKPFSLNEFVQDPGDYAVDNPRNTITSLTDYGERQVALLIDRFLKSQQSQR